ncbi:MAG TPA: hypothetical protein VMU05_09675 [Dongiaceae bacterium]|nr:hypothetical protein [Dongiaceae bacterium]
MLYLRFSSRSTMEAVAEGVPAVLLAEAPAAALPVVPIPEAVPTGAALTAHRAVPAIRAATLEGVTTLGARATPAEALLPESTVQVALTIGVVAANPPAATIRLVGAPMQVL